MASYKPKQVELITTASSANARKKSYKVHNSIIYFCFCDASRYDKYYCNLMYTGSKYNENNSGDVPSPYFTPTFVLKELYY